MTEEMRKETQLGLAELERRIKRAGIGIISQNKMPHREATYLAIGNSDRKTDITLPDEFLDDLPNTKDYQIAVDAYADAVSGRVKCGSPEVFYCISGTAVEISILWPIQSAVSSSRFSRFILMDVTDQGTGEIAKCSIELGFTLGQTVLDIVVLTVNSVRTAIDQKQVKFYKPGVPQEVYQRVQRNEEPSRKTQSEIERFIAGKAYILGFLAVDKPGEIWAADPWDASYLGVSKKELVLAKRTLQAKGFLDAGSGEEYARPTDKLLAEKSSEKSETESLQPENISRLDLPTKQSLLEDLRTILNRNSFLAVIVIDLDNFKAVNETKGHPEGDLCLDKVAQTVATVVGRKGKLYRWGSGDEFVVSLPDFSTEEAQATAERIRTTIERVKPGGDITVTASIGICATDRTESRSAEEILKFADQATFESKRLGKNRVTTWPFTSH